MHNRRDKHKHDKHGKHGKHGDPGHDDAPRGPRFGEAREGAVLQIPPPFGFQGVNCRVFPLRANMSRLVHYCNAFINSGVPDDIVFFRPAMPVVFLQLIYYGKMAVETQNFGWFSQHEFVFSVPVEQYKMVDGRPVFQNWGLLNPFIYVDKESSEIIGREVYGWPKVHGWLSSDVDSWMENVRSDRQMAALNTMVYDSVYTGQAMHGRPLIEVYEKPMPSWSRVKPNLTDGMNPVSIVPRAARNFMRVLDAWWSNVSNLSTGTALTWLDNYPVKGIDPAGNGVGDLRKIASLIPKLLPVNKDNHYSLYTLKQFRDAEDPRFACYQSVISSQMYLDQFNAGGMLGDARLSLGDTTGGFYVNIHEYPSQPIVQSLGLEPSATHENADGIHTCTFEPLLPFWMDVDISYDKGDILCSQTSWSNWEKGNTPKHKPAKKPPRKKASPLVPLSIGDLQDSHLYNTARGEASEEMIGPFYFPNATIRVLSFLACQQTLQTFVSENYNCAGQSFRVLGDNVYMLITNFDEMASAHNNIGRWAHREVRFVIPVCWNAKTDGGGSEPVSVAMVSPFIFTDRDVHMNTLREVYGEPAFKASIECPKGSWMQVDGPAVPPDVMDLYTDVLPSLFTGSRMIRRKLISVGFGDVLPPEHEGWREIVSNWGSTLVDDLTAKQTRAAENPEALDIGKALALEVLANGQPINQISKKQFRDAYHIDRACYQALVNTKTTIEHVEDFRDIEEQMHVCMYEYPTQPIVRLLGLKPKWIAPPDKPHGAILQPVRQFWMKVALRIGESENVAERAGESGWRHRSEGRREGYFTQTEPCDVGPALARSLDAVTSEARRAPESPTPPEVDLYELSSLHAPGSGPAGESGDEPDLAEFSGLDEAVLDCFLNRNHRHRYLKLAAEKWRADAPDSDLTSRATAAKVLCEGQVTPQMIIDSMLGHEWCHWGNPRFYRRLFMNEPITQLPDFCIRRDSVGEAARDLFPKEQSMEAWRGGWYPKPEE